MWMYVVAIILIGFALFAGVKFGRATSEWLDNQDEREERKQHEFIYFDE